MSWLSSLFGGGGEDPRAVQQRQEASAREAAQIQAEAMRAQVEQQRQAQQAQMDYLNQLRQDQLAEEARIKAADPTATRTAALQSVNSRFTPGFESNYVPDTYDDELINAIYGEQSGTANSYIDRLLGRGVITDTGAAAARGELEKQAPRVRTQLSDIGNTILSGERSKLGNIAGQARERTTGLGVNEAFDLTPYETQLQGSLKDFGSKFSDLFRSNVQGDLFDVSGLSSVAGGAQGPQDLAFDPDAVKGFGAGGATEDTSDPFSGQKPIQKRTSTVF
jgi:hypothetical protein